METTTKFEASVFRGDLRVVTDAEGNVEIPGARDEAAAFLHSVQSDDLRQVREMYAAGERDETEKALRGKAPLGQEIANRSAQVIRRVIESGVVSYSDRQGQWVLNSLKLRNMLFRMPSF